MKAFVIIALLGVASAAAQADNAVDSRLAKYLLSRARASSLNSIQLTGPSATTGNDNLTAPAAGALPRRVRYTNPVLPNAPDPHVIRVNSTYYLYATNPVWGFRVFTSPDLVRWADAGMALWPEPRTGSGNYWAPDVSAIDGTYYMMYTATGGTAGSLLADQRLYVAKAASPLGPFVYHSGPLLPSFSIDSHHFRDTDGSSYMYYSTIFGGIWGVRMTRDLTRTRGKPVFAFSATSQPEGWVAENVNEAPFVLKRNGTYYLVYSGNACCTNVNYGLGYATASSPLGPWTKSRSNPIVWRTAESPGPGHASFVRSPRGQLFAAYHIIAPGPSADQGRALAIDRAVFVKDPAGGADLLTVPGAPTRTPQWV